MGCDYLVYEHVFENGKKYIGITSDIRRRWTGKGCQYFDQPKIGNAIKKYGWDNIEHNVIIDGLSKNQANKLERYLIRELDTIENGYNASIGGDSINGTFLNPHVLKMIRESRYVDDYRGLEENPYGIVALAEKAKTDANLAKLFNYADGQIEKHYPEYKSYKYGGNIFHCAKEIRVDCYWWYVAQIVINGAIPESYSSRPYWEAWLNDFENDGE